MKIIFTDIDGVLNPNWKKKWSKTAVNNFNIICEELDLKPVITSTWRISNTIEQLQEIFRTQGIRIPIYDYTPLIDQSDRGLEIKEWLLNNNCDNYVVIDDKISDIVDYIDNVVYCVTWDGLTQKECNLIRDILS